MLATIISMGICLRTARADPDIFYVDDDSNSSTPGWGFDHFNKIQDAVDAATDGDTIYVYSGTYYEDVQVDEKNNLKFIAEKAGQPVKSVIVNPGKEAGFWIWGSSGTKISGFKITNASNGIDTYMADYSDFSNNHIENCSSWGIYLIGNYSKIANNYLKNTHGGILCSLVMHRMIGDVFSKNTILNTKPSSGIDITNGVNCSITNNFISNASVGIKLDHYEADCSGNMITNNEISNSAIGIKLGDYANPGEPSMTDNVIGRNYIHDATPYPSYGGEGIYIEYNEGREVAEHTQIHHNTIEDFNVGIRNYGDYGSVHHNNAINCTTDYVDLGSGNVDYKNSWNT